MKFRLWVQSRMPLCLPVHTIMWPRKRLRQINQMLISYHLASQPQSTNNSEVAFAPIQSKAALPAAIPVVNADHASTVARPPTVEQVVPQRGGAQRYDLRPCPEPSTRDAVWIIVALILLLPLAACSSPMSPLVGVARNNKNTLRYWALMGNVRTWEALIVPLILAMITLIRLIIKKRSKTFA